MSSNPKTDERNRKRISSITRKLHWYGLRKKMALCLSLDLFYFLLICVLWCLNQEYSHLYQIFSLKMLVFLIWEIFV